MDSLSEVFRSPKRARSRSAADVISAAISAGRLLHQVREFLVPFGKQMACPGCCFLLGDLLEDGGSLTEEIQDPLGELVEQFTKKLNLVVLCPMLHPQCRKFGLQTINLCAQRTLYG